MTLLVGLTGGIGSGKSTVARMLAERGAAIVDADQAARDLQAVGGPLIPKMVEAFGEGILTGDGGLDRAAVARLVFGDSAPARERLARLNKITHPVIHDEIERRIASARTTSDIVVVDHPLLVERPLADIDRIVVVDLPPELQIERLVGERGMDRGDAERRLASQVDREQRLAIADYVVENVGDLSALKREVDALWAQLGDDRTKTDRRDRNS